MQSETLRSGSNKQWPDFYSILDSPLESDGETLRRVINKLYIKASEQSDHRELSTRFYNQVLAQKVLPQCRVILLNKSMREAYDRQWVLHRDGANTALAYPDFIQTISKDADSARALLLSSEEISILPSFGADQTAPALAPLKPATGPSTPPPEPPSPKKSFPVGAAIAAVVLLAGAGGFAWNASRHTTPSISPVASAPVASSKAPSVVTAPATPTLPSNPPLMKLNTLARNADFENGQVAWQSSHRSGFLGPAYQHDAKSGGNLLTFWNQKSTDSTVTQTIKGLKPGKYTLRAWTRRTGGQDQADMFAEDYGGPKRTRLMPYGWTYFNTTLTDIEVTSGQCTIGFSVKSSANKSTSVDAVEFFRQ